MNIKETVEKIHRRIYKNRLQPNKISSKWTFVRSKDFKDKIDAEIERLLCEGYIVSGGYYTTGVRGFHEYYLMYKKSKKV